MSKMTKHMSMKPQEKSSLSGRAAKIGKGYHPSLADKSDEYIQKNVRIMDIDIFYKK